MTGKGKADAYGKPNVLKLQYMLGLKSSTYLAYFITLGESHQLMSQTWNLFQTFHHNVSDDRAFKKLIK